MGLMISLTTAGWRGRASAGDSSMLCCVCRTFLGVYGARGPFFRKGSRGRCIGRVLEPNTAQQLDTAKLRMVLSFAVIVLYKMHRMGLDCNSCLWSELNCKLRIACIMYSTMG